MGIIWDMENLAGGPRTGFEVHEASNQVVLHESQDVDLVLRANQYDYNSSGHDGYTDSRDMQHVASIPQIFLDKWYREEGIKWWDSEDSAKLLQKLDDPDWRFLRTSAGHLARRPFRHYSRASNHRKVTQ